MNEQNWNDTLRVLCMMILVDEKVYDEEVEAFKSAAMALRDIVNPKLMLTPHMAQDWFHQHEEDISISVSAPYYESTVSQVLYRLKEVPDKTGLISALQEVAISDGQKHSSEDKLLKTACETWGLDTQLNT